MPTALLLLLATFQAPAPPAPERLLEEVTRLAQSATNEARFETLTAMLRARNLPFTVEPFTLDAPREREPRTDGRNIIVTLGTGGAPLVVGAHYDAARLPDGSLSRGAVDNAASSVLLVGLADALRAGALAREVRIVWFDMEELGLLGSERYVQAHAGDGLAGMLNFDVNGYGDTLLFGPTPRQESAALRRSLLRVCAEHDLACIPFPQMPPSDDRPFVNGKIPALSIAMLPAAEAHQLWLLMNGGGASKTKPELPPVLRTIHTPEDTADKVQGETLARMLRFALALVQAVT